MNERIWLERQYIQQHYRDYLVSKLGVPIPDEQVVYGSAADFYSANGLDPVPSVFDLSGIGTIKTASVPVTASILQAEIDQLEMESFFPKRSRNFTEFKEPVFEQINARQKKILPQVKNQAHRTELAGYYHELLYESNEATESDYRILDRERVSTYKVVDGKILEATQFDGRKLWYGAAQSKLEGQLFGVNYDDISRNQPVERDRALPLESDYDVINAGRIATYKGIGKIEAEPLVISSLAHPVDVTLQKFVKDEFLKYQKQIEAAPQDKKPKLPKEKPYLEGYDKKMICGREYDAYNLPSVLDGYKKNSSPGSYDAACHFVPSLCHALVALLACETCETKLREEDVFLCTCERELITVGRQALPIRDILKLIRDTYPRLIDRYIRPPLKCFETIMTALLFMVSPNDEEILEMEVLPGETQFVSHESLFDQRAGMPETVHFPLPLPRPPNQPAMIPQFLSGKTAIYTAAETYSLEGDKTELQRRYNQTNFKREPQQKPSFVQADQSAKFAQEIIATTGKIAHFPVSQIINNTKICRIEHAAENIQQTLESNAKVYVGQEQFGVLYQNADGQYFDNLWLGSKELLKIDERTLYASAEEKEKAHQSQESKQMREVNSDSEDDVPADEIPFQSTPQCAVMGLSSPLLGEFILIPGKRPEHIYFGVDADYLARIAAVFNYECELDRYEIVTARQRFGNGEFDKIAENEYTEKRIESLQKSKQRVSNSLEAVGQMYTDQQKYHYRAQERLRYFLLPHTTFPYVILGLKSLSLKEKTAEVKQESFKYIEYEKCVPQHLSKIAAVQDAICRLNGRFGTREDIMERCCDSNFYSWRDPRLEAKVSCALDRLRLHFVDPDKKMRLAMFDEKNKIWMLASARLQILLGDYAEEEWPSDLYDMYQRGNRGLRALGR